MLDKDMRPTRFDLCLQYAREFIVEWFDQNPLGQIAVVGMRSGLGEKLGEMTGEILAYSGVFRNFPGRLTIFSCLVVLNARR